MEPRYNLTINLDEKWRKQWSAVPDMMLYLAKDVSNGGKDSYHNLIAYDAPTDGSLFINKIECSAVLYRQINGKSEQIYTSHGGDMPPGSSEMIIPQKKVYVWFSDDITSTTVDGRMAQAEVLEFDFDGHGEMMFTFNDAGVWSIS
ncbi:hypothetical protein ACHAPZ_000395 [Fusarium culmorum]